MGWFYPTDSPAQRPSEYSGAIAVGNAPPSPIASRAAFAALYAAWAPESWPAQRGATIAHLFANSSTITQPINVRTSIYATWPAESWPAQRGAEIANFFASSTITVVPSIPALQSHPANLFGTEVTGAEQQFKMQHHLRHVTYDYAASKLGISLAGLDLTGRISRDWLFRHSGRHKTYRNIQGARGRSPTCDLESLDWRNKRAVRSWMQYHAQLHADLDVFFGLRS